jgi:GNAT superfamily N-acetyltransferase
MDENSYRLQAAADDTEFLYQVYASTREAEMALTGWSREETEAFLRFQFQVQHVQYHNNYPNAFFNIIFSDEKRVGRLYLNRSRGEIRIIDISLLTEFRGHGLGTRILQDIIAEAETAGVPVRLTVRFDNPARHLYERLGFIVKNNTEVDYFMERPATIFPNRVLDNTAKYH